MLGALEESRDQAKEVYDEVHSALRGGVNADPCRGQFDSIDPSDPLKRAF